MVRAIVWDVVTVPAPMSVKASSVSRSLDFSAGGRSPARSEWKNVRCDESACMSLAARTLSI